MKFIADFHVHSKYSRATSKNSDLENLYISAQLKGINVIGTGDFTHPGWFSEIEKKLSPAEEGLFKLKREIAKPLNEHIPGACRGDVRFILTSEISSIYKKNGKTRKNHNLVFIPDLSIAKQFNSKLDKIGNINSDGRPILGLDAKNLLEIVLDTSDNNFLIPAHIWTPWFSLLGSKSGFDTLEECFEDLTEYIFAVETGLSSDPPMNRRIKFLDDLTLISNSDAHSPNKLGREANLFDTDMSFGKIRRAMEKCDSDAFLGTFEFYPEEGKYHLDGHRKCGIRSWPNKTIAKNGICPVCEKPMTLGVLYRVEKLADRAEGFLPENKPIYQSIIPLREIISAVLGVGPDTKKVSYHYNRLLHQFGPELEIINSLPIEQIDYADLPGFGEAIQRVRQKNVTIYPGYDGEFGKIEIFNKDEWETLCGQKKLFTIPSANFPGKNKQREKPDVKINIGVKEKRVTEQEKKSKETEKRPALNEQQQRAIHHIEGPLIIVAGPGTGKTLTITHKIAHLIKTRLVHSENILALTFTNKAAEEMGQRLSKVIKNIETIPLTATFHAFCVHVLQDFGKEHNFRIIDDIEKKYFLEQSVHGIESTGLTVGFKTSDLMNRVAREKQQIHGPHKQPETIENLPEKVFQHVYKYYQNLIMREHLWDYEDLIGNVVMMFEKNPTLLKKVRNRYRFVFVDEYQDVNFAQYRIIKLLAPPNANICVIGDPDQAIYSFRGSDVSYFNRFVKDYPLAESINLSRNYRSVQVVIEASQQMIKKTRQKGDKETIFSKIMGPKSIEILPCADEQGEAVVIGKEIENMVGGLGFYSIDFGKTDNDMATEDYSFGDMAILFRTGRQCDVFAEIFYRAGIPYQVASKDSTFSEKSVATILSFLKIIGKSGSYLDMERVLKNAGSGLGEKTVRRWKTWAFKKGFRLEEALNNIRRFPVQQMKKDRQLKFVQFLDRIQGMQSETDGLDLQEKIHYILEKTTICAKMGPDGKSREILENFIEGSKKYETTEDLLMASTLQTDADAVEKDVEKVSLMTIHASKGLEFPVVFICGCENGYLPFKQQEEDCDNEGEERRLLYVAMTRAKQALYLSYAKKRRIFGKVVTREPSKFIWDIKPELKHYRHVADGRFKKKGHTQLDLF